LWILRKWWRRSFLTLPGDQQIDEFADDVDREEERREPDIEERRGQQGHGQEGALPLPGKRKDSIRVVTQILQQPFGSGGSRLDVLLMQVRHRPIVCCAIIAVAVPVSIFSVRDIARDLLDLLTSPFLTHLCGVLGGMPVAIANLPLTPH
jgi:hypothetical protein